MFDRLRLLALPLVLVAACGDGGSSAPDATPDATPDSPTPPDAASCERTGYPAAVTPVSIDNPGPEAITLRGAGTRCEQIIATVLGPAADRPRSLMAMDLTDATATCAHDDVTGREIVRVRAPSYLGEPLYWPVQDALLHVDARDQIVFLRADYLPLGADAVTGCLGDGEVSAITGTQALPYQRFAACSPQGPGSYQLTASDVIELGDEGYYLDDAMGLHRVRAVDAYLAPGNVTAETTNSDLFCCSDVTLDHCVGQRLFIDVITGEVIGRAPHCHTC